MGLREFPFDETKFREIVVYTAWKSQDDSTFGSIKLNKILYYSDFAAYRHLGEPITGAAYRKLSQGPAPAQLVEQRRILLDSGDLAVEERPHFTGAQQRLVPSPERRPRLDCFTDKELKIIDEVIAFFRGKSAREAAQFSQAEPGWKIADDFEIIPYETAWLSAEPLDQAGEERLRQEIA